MPTHKYMKLDGTAVVGVTTAIGLLGLNKTPLMYWAWEQGKAGKDFRETKDNAADSGTLAHYLIECDIHGTKPDQAILDKAGKDILDKAETAYLNFLEWKKTNHIELVHTELPLVSEKYGYGGTIDYIGKVDGKYALLDWKTSTGVYADYLIQVAAYTQLWLEHNPDKPLTGGIHLLRIDKDNGKFTHHRWDSTPPEAFDIFLDLLDIYNKKKVVDKAAK